MFAVLWFIFVSAKVYDSFSVNYKGVRRYSELKVTIFDKLVGNDAILYMYSLGFRIIRHGLPNVYFIEIKKCMFSCTKLIVISNITKLFVFL